MKKILTVLVILMIVIINAEAEDKYDEAFFEWSATCNMAEIRNLDGTVNICIEFTDRDGYIWLEAESVDAETAEIFVYIGNELVMNEIVTEDTISEISMEAFYLIYESGV